MCWWCMKVRANRSMKRLLPFVGSVSCWKWMYAAGVIRVEWERDW